VRALDLADAGMRRDALHLRAFAASAVAVWFFAPAGAADEGAALPETCAEAERIPSPVAGTLCFCFFNRMKLTKILFVQMCRARAAPAPAAAATGAARAVAAAARRRRAAW
jgi:hypothetical protein